jgi:hypothetical protein
MWAEYFVRSQLGLFSLRTAHGFVPILTHLQIDDGEKKSIIRHEKALEGIVTTVASDEDYLATLMVVAGDMNLSLAIQDLAQALSTHHEGLIHCARAVEAICANFIPQGKDRREFGWGPMQTSLNVSKALLQSITRHSTNPRHGIRFGNVPVDGHDIGRKTWEVMNRYLKFRMTGNQPLSPDDFPLLD